MDMILGKVYVFDLDVPEDIIEMILRDEDE